MLKRVFVCLGFFVFVSLVGVAIQYYEIKKKKDNYEFLHKYFENFKKFCETMDMECYTYIQANLNRAQSILTDNGLVTIRLPFENGYHRNVPVLTLLNYIVDEQRTSFGDPYPYISCIEQAIVRTIGDYDQYFDNAIKKIFNIFIAFYKGFHGIISAPFIALSYMVSGKNFFSESKGLSVIINVLSGLGSFIGILSGIMSIVLGFEEFFALIKMWFSAS